jgi:hypothetical protein
MPGELRELRIAEFGGDETDACEAFLTLSTRIEAALDLAIGDGLAALSIGDRLISLGYSNLTTSSPLRLSSPPRDPRRLGSGL